MPTPVALDAPVATGLGACYFAVPWALAGRICRTLALAIRVRGRADGETLSIGRALARWILLFPPFATVSALTAGIPLLGAFGFALWSPVVEVSVLHESHRVEGRRMQGYLASSKEFQLDEGLLGLQIRLEPEYGAPDDASDFARQVMTLAGNLDSWQGDRNSRSARAHFVSRHLRGRIETIGLTTRIEPARTPAPA